MAMISFDPEFFEVKPTWDDKGNGVFSRRVIPAGTVIVKETPLLRHPENPAGFQYEQIPDLIVQFDALRPFHQNELLSLYTVKHRGEDPDALFDYLRNTYTRPDGTTKLSYQEARRYMRMVVVLWSNQIGILDEQGEEHRGLYLRTSRLNHRCAPNLLTNLATDGEITLRARNRILPGDELSISYIALDLPRAERRAALLEDFEFECKCELCDEYALAADADDHEHRVAQLHIYDLGETMRLYTENEFSLFPAEDCDQYLARCQKRFVHYTKLSWNDMAFYELLNIADLWARVWALTPNNTPAAPGAAVSPRAQYAAMEWNRSLTMAVDKLGPLVMDRNDTHLEDARRALNQPGALPNIIRPLIPAPEDARVRSKSRTPEGRPMRRDRTASAEPQGQGSQAPGAGPSGGQGS
ncbi:hypothetical protein PG984_016421 [Apiospora sp. TS-2023a]